MKVLGKIPVNEFDSKSIIVTSPSNPISDGKQPESLLLRKLISFKVFVILPMLLGMHPLNLLLANTTTETGELPRFSGIYDVNLLSFKNNASRSLLKSS